MAGKNNKTGIIIPGAQPTPDPITARPISISKKSAKKKVAKAVPTKPSK